MTYVKLCKFLFRKTAVTSGDGLIRLWRKFICVHVYVLMLDSFFRVILPIVICCLFAGQIVALFVAIRSSGISGWLACSSGFGGLTVLVVQLWICQQGLTAFELGEDTLARIRSTEHKFFRRLDRQEQLFLRKLARATRMPKPKIGPFIDFSLKVPIGIWEETLNQLLFLLSY